MDITAVDRVAALPAEAPAIPVDRAAENRDVVRAVRALNSAEMFGQENELLFQLDQRTQRMLIRVVNSRTREVISQVPAEYVLRLAEEIKAR